MEPFSSHFPSFSASPFLLPPLLLFLLPPPLFLHYVPPPLLLLLLLVILLRRLLLLLLDRLLLLFLILLLVIFILIDVPRSLNNGNSAAGQITRTIQHYFAIKTFTSFLTGLAIGVWLMILDVQYPMLWGFLAFLFNFVPNIGSVIASLPALFLAIIFQGYGVALIVMIGYVVINVGISNGLEPRILGQQLGLRFVWIFLSLILWGWILGPVGMLLAVPLTMTLRIVLENHRSSEWIALILMPDKAKREG